VVELFFKLTVAYVTYGYLPRDEWVLFVKKED